MGAGGGGQGSDYWGPRGGGGQNFSPVVYTFLTLKIDNIAKLRIELKSILLEIPSNKIKSTYTHILNGYICDLVLLFHIDIEGKCWWIIKGGAKGICPPPSRIIGGLPPPTYAYENYSFVTKELFMIFLHIQLSSLLWFASVLRYQLPLEHNKVRKCACRGYTLLLYFCVCLRRWSTHR